MPITLRHDAAAVALPANSANRKYGQQLVLQQQQQRQQQTLQQQQQKYQGYQAGLDRLFDVNKQMNQNDFVLQRDQALGEQRLQQQQAEQRQRFMEEARKLESGMIMEDIKNGLYDPETATRLQQSLAEEARALGSDQYDATQRAEALKKIRDKRLLDSTNRLQKPPQPTREEELQKFLGPNYEQYKDQPWVPDGKGGFAVAKDALVKQQKEQELQQKAEQEAAKMRPKSFQDYYRENEDKFQKDLDSTMTSMRDEVTAGTRTGAVTPEAALAKMQEDYKFRQKALGRSEYGEPTVAPALPGEAPVAAAPSFAPGSRLADQATALGMNPSKSILEAPPRDTSAQDRVGELLGQQSVPRGAPPQPISPDSRIAGLARSLGIDANPLTAQRPDPGMPPAPSDPPPGQPMFIDPNGSRPYYMKDGEPVYFNPETPTPVNPQPQAPQKVNVGGKPLAVTPGTLTPQETAARAQVMEMPREDRIRALLPYDPQMKGRTLEQVLEDPETKAQYDELSKQGLTTGNYKEDILNHMDEMLQHNVLNASGMPQEAYVGMRADEITDPKAKAEVAKMPRPKSADDRNSIRSGQMYVDPEGVIRART